MTVDARRHRYTYEQYLHVEERSEVKHEYLDGEIYAMAGGTPEHAALMVASTVQFGARPRDGRCRTYSSELRVRAAELTTYPDLTVVCGEVRTAHDDRNAATNPTGIVEVLSPSTASWDRGEKREHYQRIDTLTDLLFVSHDRRRIEHWRRAAGSEWSCDTHDEGTVELTSIEAG